MEKLVAIYARQSVDKKDSVSIEAQINDCKTLCKNGVKVIEYADKGFSGKNTDRPQLQALIADIKADLIDAVYVYKLDRISRNINDFYNLYTIMSEHGCEFKSYNESFDTSNSMGRAMMGILAVFAQMERENIQARIKDNISFRLTEKGWVGGKAPFGFNNTKIDGKASIIPVEKEVEAVKYMFNTYAGSTSISLGKLQSSLIEKGYTGKQSTKGFSRATINRILSNPVYASADNLLYKYYESKLASFANSEEDWDGSSSASFSNRYGRALTGSLEGVSMYLTGAKPIVSSELFLMVQERLSQNSALASDNTPSNRAKELSGLLRCSNCGISIKLVNTGCLVCRGRGQNKICDVSYAGIKFDDVRNEVAVQIQNYLDDFEDYHNQKLSEKKRLQSELDELVARRDKLIDLAMFSDNVDEAVKSRLDKTQNEIKALQLKQKMNIDTRDVVETRLGISSIFELMGNNQYAYLTDEVKQTILRALVDKIYLDANGKVKIVYKDLI